MRNKITTFKQLKNSYEKIWTKTNLVEEDYYYKWIVSLWGDIKNKKLLDIGCGGGYLLEKAEKVGMKTYGIDISQAATEKARRRAPNSEIIAGVAEKLPFKKNSFDIVACLGSLEHFLDTKKALREMHRVLKGDGFTCIVLPNRWAIDAIFEGAFRGIELSHGQELEYFYNYREAHDLLTGNGFKIMESFGYNRPYATYISTGTKTSTLANLLYKLIYKFIRWKIPVRLSYVFVFILKKKS